MNISELSYIGLTVGIIGIVIVTIIAFCTYFSIKKAHANGKFKEYTQTYLSNSDVSIQEAVQYLKIVNTSEDIKQHDE